LAQAMLVQYVASCLIWLLLHTCVVCEQCIDSGTPSNDVGIGLLQSRSSSTIYRGDLDEEQVHQDLRDDTPASSKRSPAAKLQAGTRTGESQDGPSFFLVTCSIMTCLVLCMAIVSWKWLEVHRFELDNITSNDRMYLLDNAKVFAMYAVIFHHLLIWDADSYEAKTWLLGTQVLKGYIFDCVTTLHMPLFCFVSGICSQGPPSAKRVRSYIAYLVAPTLLYVFFLWPVIGEPLQVVSLNLFKERVHGLIGLDVVLSSRFYVPWYLVALIIWRGSALLYWSHLHPVALLLGALGMSCLGMYLNLAPSLLNPDYTLNSCLGYLPYFAIGYVFPFKLVCRANNPSSTQRLGAALLLILGLVLIHFLQMNLFPGEWLPNAHGFQTQFDEKSWGGLWNNRLRWTSRSAKVVVDTSATVVLILFVLPRHETCLTWIGSHTLYVYLFHTIAIGWKGQLVEVLHLPQEQHWAVHVAVLLVHALYSLGALVFFASPPWRWLFQVFLSPTWLDRLLERLFRSADQSCANIIQHSLSNRQH